MSDKRMTHEAFVAATETAAWVGIDALVAMLDAADYWDEGFLETVEQVAKKAHARQQIKQVTDGNGFPLFANVTTIDPISGKQERTYKQEAMFDRDDYVQVVRFHQHVAEYHTRRAAENAKRGHDRYGLQLGLELVMSNA